MNTQLKLITKKLIRNTFVIMLLLFVQQIKAQEQKEINGKTYTIVDNGSVTNIQPYIDALNNANMSNHRLRDKRYIVVFQTGVKVELFSASEIAKSGISLVLSDYPLEFDSSRNEPIFSLAPNNFIIEYHVASNQKRQ